MATGGPGTLNWGRGLLLLLGLLLLGFLFFLLCNKRHFGGSRGAFLHFLFRGARQDAGGHDRILAALGRKRQAPRRDN